MTFITKYSLEEEANPLFVQEISALSIYLVAVGSHSAAPGDQLQVYFPVPRSGALAGVLNQHGSLLVWEETIAPRGKPREQGENIPTPH